MRNQQWREVGVGAQILRDLGVTSIRHLTSSAVEFRGLGGFGIEIVATEPFKFDPKFDPKIDPK
jgi:3,4-dihydroxy 2-butanone 4-phosphate synthase/GTP cyclohydrolase II